MAISRAILFFSSTLLSVVVTRGLVQTVVSSWLSHLVCFTIGLLIVHSAKHTLKQLFDSPQAATNSQLTQTTYPKGSVYSFDHARLNIDLPPKTLWMNMGYWKDTKEFPRACEALLEEVLKTAGLLSLDGKPAPAPIGRWTKLVDLGYGCGDQTLYLIRDLRKCIKSGQTKPDLQEVKPLLDSYVGITLDPGQASYARERLRSEGLIDDARTNLYCADAAKPETWSGIGGLIEKITEQTRNDTYSPSRVHAEDKCHWFLALDTLYHFSPSRIPILDYACKEGKASFMAFDLLLSDSAPFIARFGLSYGARLMGCPTNAFLTESEYRALLISTGYLSENIQIRDISEHVFAPLTNFLTERDVLLKQYGWGLGKLAAAKMLFGWWAKTGVVRGVIVVANYEPVAALTEDLKNRPSMAE